MTSAPISTVWPLVVVFLGVSACSEVGTRPTALPDNPEPVGETVATPPDDSEVEGDDSPGDDTSPTDPTSGEELEEEPEEEPEPVQTYLVHVQGNRLVKIHTGTGAEQTICNFSSSMSYPSITFGINGNLYGSRMGHLLDLIDPCTCETTHIGDIGYSSVAGITANGYKEIQLYGISGASDVLLEIAIADAASNEVGEGLGVDFGYLGSTWSSDINNLYSINADTDELYTVDINTGVATSIAPLDVNFGSVGIEWHPGDRELYSCTDSHLYRVNTEDGTTTEIGDMTHGCNNLAAQWTAVPCIDDLEETTNDEE